MKKYLFLAVAALGFAACAEKGLDNGPVNNGELEQSYVAITLAADDMATKAADGKYEAGLEKERYVHSAYVFFFKDGQPFLVSFDPTTSTSTNVGPKNYIEVPVKGLGTSESVNVSDVHDKVLVLQNYKGEYPDQVVAVLNWKPTYNTYTLQALKNVTPTPGNDEKGYIMSNSVYVDAVGDMVDATPLTIANIAKNSDDAKANPVTIYVERIGAKVELTTNEQENSRFPVGKVISYKEGDVEATKDVYAEVVGWELYNDNQSSYLVKNIDGYKDWTGETFGFTNWNNMDYHRSYWAKSLGTKFPENTFSWTGNNPAYVYCGENTNSWTSESDCRTKVIVKARLCDEDGNKIEVTNWYGKDYLGEETLLAVVASTLSNTYFAKDSERYVGLTSSDIKCVVRGPKVEKAYEVYFQLNTEKDWYKYENGAYTSITPTALNTELAKVQPALVYTDGMTYYWTDIKHLGLARTTTEYGVVRNHVYKVNITDIHGYGTPVYDGNIQFETPEKPKEFESYVAAEIKILSWRVVANDYQLGK